MASATITDALVEAIRAGDTELAHQLVLALDDLKWVFEHDVRMDGSHHGHACRADCDKRSPSQR